MENFKSERILPLAKALAFSKGKPGEGMLALDSNEITSGLNSTLDSG